MMRIRSLILFLLVPLAWAQSPSAADLTKPQNATLYVVGYAHLDTQWRWEFPQTISEYLLKTMRVNFDYLEKYPHYIFNWTGANRYRLMKEYFPTDYMKMKQYVAAGRWYPAGSSMEEGDVNAPGAEAILRQILYGNAYFRKEFGVASAEYMLPDCFGFPASLPSILAHAGVKGFSTQKLSAAWQPAPHVGGPDSPEKTPEGIPFNVGIWKGPDGATVIAALNPLTYSSNVTYDLSKTPPPSQNSGGRGGRGAEDWVKRINLDGEVTGLFADYHYVGTGDTGGATNEASVKLMEAIITRSRASLPPQQFGRGRGGQPEQPPPPPGPEIQMGDGPIHVEWSKADQMFKDLIATGKLQSLPTYQGDLELINHSAGSLTSQTIHKRWNRKNELLADAAEKASVAAEWLGGLPYPMERLNHAWTLVMGGHFHDTMAGTATPRAYEYAWNDDVLAMNQFAGVLTGATQSIASALNTEAKGSAVVVYNPLNIAREDVAEAEISLPDGAKAVRVTGPDGADVPAQLQDGKVLFVAKTPPVGYAVYDVQPAGAAAPSAFKVSPTGVESSRYRVTVDANGDIAGVFDKSIGKELLSAPLRLAINRDAPHDWPAWNMDFQDQQRPPLAYVAGPARVRVVEDGAVRASIEVSREAEGSKFVQRISLLAGNAGNRVEISNAIDWRGLASNVKAVFALSAGNPLATYNWDIGTIERPNANERQFEVASHQWVDLTDRGGGYGVTILTDCKNGSDKLDDRTIRLTLLRTPGLYVPDPKIPGDRAGNGANYSDQLNQEWGHHEFVFGLTGHAGDWRQAQTDWQAYRLNQPLLAFSSAKHTGALGKTFSLMSISNPRVRVMALKKAESSDEVILRMVEVDGKPARDVQIKFAGPIAAAREVNGQEQPLGAAALSQGMLVTSFTAYQPRTFALKLGAAPVKVPPVESQAVALHYDLAAASDDDTRSAPGFDSKGNALPAEQLPSELTFNGVRFALAPAKTGAPNAMIAKGQTIRLPPGRFNRVYVLAAAEGDRKSTFRVGDQPVDLTVQDWGGFVGQWDTRVWKRDGPEHDWAVSANHAAWDLQNRGVPRHTPRYPKDYDRLTPGFIKRADVAWYASHHHTPEGLNQPYAYSYLFAYALDLPSHATSLKIPDNDRIRILAISVAGEAPKVTPAQPLYDTLDAGHLAH